MKRVDPTGHPGRHGREFLREGNKHTVYVNRLENNFLARKICTGPQIPKP